MNKFLFLFFYLLISLFLAGCGNNFDNIPAKKLLDISPQVQEKNDYCIPACISMVSSYYGKEISQSKIWKIANNSNATSSAAGLSESFTVDYFNKNNLYASFFHGNLRNVRYFLSKGLPVIFFWNIDYIGHAVLICGYDDIKGKLFIYEPSHEKSLFTMNYDTAQKIFNESFYMSVVISKKIITDKKNRLLSFDLNINNAHGNKKIIDTLLRLIEKYNEPVLYYNLAHIFFIENKFDESIKWLNKYVKQFSENSSVYNLLGNCYLGKKKLIKSEHYYKLGIKCYPYNLELYYNIALLYETENKDKKMLEFTDLGLKNNNSYLPLYHFLKQYYFSKNDLTNAEKILSKYLEYNGLLKFYPFFNKQYYIDMTDFLNLKLDESTKAKIQEILCNHTKKK